MQIFQQSPLGSFLIILSIAIVAAIVARIEVICEPKYWQREIMIYPKSYLFRKRIETSFMIMDIIICGKIINITTILYYLADNINQPMFLMLGQVVVFMAWITVPILIVYSYIAQLPSIETTVARKDSPYYVDWLLVLLFSI